MRLGEVGGGPLSGVVWVRVVEADDVEPEGAGLPLNFDELLRGDVVAVVRGVSAGVAAACRTSTRPPCSGRTRVQPFLSAL